MSRKYNSGILKMCHEEIIGLHEAGAISDERMKEFDEMYLAAEVPRVSRPARGAADRPHSPVSVSTRR
jgi:DNA-binding transcriptional regulator YiaG